ncbi:MAG: hypothetical protein ABIO29_01700 [Sphingomicrobium sp.]
MEGDNIRTGGGNTLVDLWVEGGVRELAISNEAVAAAVGAPRAAAMSDDERCEFVRTRLALVQSAARTALAEGDRDLVRITLKAACLVDPSLGSGGERRSDERRSDERRTGTAPGTKPSTGDRRRADRRRGERRGTTEADPPV